MPIVKFIDVIRKFKKDKDVKTIEIAKLEELAAQFDSNIELSFKKYEIEKERADLENEKLSLEIDKMKDDKFFVTSEGQAFKIKDIISIDEYDGIDYVARVQIKNKNHFIFLTEKEHKELIDKLKE